MLVFALARTRGPAQCAETEDGNSGERDDLEPLRGVFSFFG